MLLEVDQPSTAEACSFESHRSDSTDRRDVKVRAVPARCVAAA
jgi:hypothetical protein